MFDYRCKNKNCSRFRLASFDCDSSTGFSLILVFFFSHTGNFVSFFSFIILNSCCVPILPLIAVIFKTAQSWNPGSPTARKIDSTRWSWGCTLKFWRRKKLTDIRGKEIRKKRKTKMRNQGQKRLETIKRVFSLRSQSIRKKSQTIYM